MIMPTNTLTLAYRGFPVIALARPPTTGVNSTNDYCWRLRPIGRDESFPAGARPWNPRGAVAVTGKGKVHRVNARWFATEMRIVADMRDRWCGVLVTRRGRIELERVSAVWYRAPAA